MKKAIITPLLFMAVITVNAQFLFRVNGGGIEKPSYILGSIHTLPGSILDSIPEFLKAEAECQQLYSEYDVSDQQKMNAAASAGQQAIVLPDGKTIFDIFNMEQLDALNYRFKEVFNANLTDSVMKSTWNYQPFVFLTTFTLMFTTEEMKKHPEFGMVGVPMDMACINRAKERGLILGQLDQIQSEDSLTKMRNNWLEKIDSQVDSLMSFLDKFEQHKQQIADDVKAAVSSTDYWKKGDFDSFNTDSFWLSQIDKNPALFKQRNERWLPKITSAMKQAPTLFVFGGGHLIGKDGIINKLREAGYQVEQIKKN